MRVTEAQLPNTDKKDIVEVNLGSNGFLPPDVINMVNDATNIVEIIGESIELKRSGKEFSACCPFHGEKTPSFTVNEDKQFYHCFGCGAHGNAISFAVEYLHYDFIEAVEYLAERESIELNFEKPKFKNYAKAKAFAVESSQPIEIDNQKAFFHLLEGLKIPRQAAEKRMLSIVTDNKGAADLIPEVVSPSLMFPVMDRSERVIGFALEDIKTTVPSIYPDNAIFGVAELKRREHLFVTEKPSQAVRLLESGVVDCVSYSSIVPDKEQLTKILKLNSSCVFCFHIGLKGYNASWSTLKMLLPLLSSKNHIRFLFYSEDLAQSLIDFAGDRDIAVNCSDLLADKISDMIKKEIESNPSMKATENYLANRSRVFTSVMPDGIYKDMFDEHVRYSLNEQFMPAPQIHVL